MNMFARRKAASWTLLVALLLSMLPATIIPSSAQAQDVGPATADQAGATAEIVATSADASEEIVYLDGNGFVRVLDVQYESEASRVTFVSAEGGWRDLALGDVNNDGDDEVVVVKGSNASDSVVAIFDPVVTTGTPGQIARFSLPERPETVATGEFDLNVSGDELVVVREVLPGESGNNDGSRTVIYKQTVNNGNGANWTVHNYLNADPIWERIEVANVDNTGIDEIGLIGEDTSNNDLVKTQVFRPEGTAWPRLYENDSSCRPPKAIAFGQFFKGGPVELIQSASQKCSNSGIQAAFRVFQYNGTIFPEDQPSFEEKFDPEPGFLFTGDITGAGDDDEVVLLRNVAPGTAGAIRLFVRGNGDDQIISEFVNGLPLDDNNSYRAGAAGDIDGDGKDEIVLIRDNNIRYYPNANTSAAAVDYPTTTNRRSVVIGDLDRVGGGSGPFFTTSIAKLEITASFGFTTTETFTLRNGNTEDAIPFFVAVDGNPNWISVMTPSGSFATAPGKSSGGIQITVKIDGSKLQPGQTYTAAIRIQNTGTPAATNSPLLIPVSVTVQLPPFEAVPAGVSALYVPCSSTPLTPRTFTLELRGLAGSQLRDVQVWDALTAASLLSSSPGELFMGSRAADGSLALSNAAGAQAVLPAVDGMTLEASSVSAIEATADVTYTSRVPWITSVSVNTTTLPALLTLQVDPTLRTQPFERAGLVLIGPSYDIANPIAVRSYPINLICSEYGLWMPITSK